MEYRRLNGSGLFVPALTVGTGTFGGSHGFEGWGHTGVKEATHMVDMCLDAGLPKKYWVRRLQENVTGCSLLPKGHFLWEKAVTRRGLRVFI